MKLKLPILVSSVLLASMLANSNLVYAMGKSDDPLLRKTMGEIETLKEGDADVIEWEVDTWIGYDFNKLWIKTEGEYAKEEGESETESANIEMVWSHAVAPYWDRQIGIRYDFKPDEPDNRTWLSVGFRGTAPYFWEIDANLYIGEDSSSQLNIEVEKELMLTQKWVITPEFDITVNGNTNEEYGEGSGLASIEAGIRIGYEFSRQFQPFIGIEGKQLFGKTKKLEDAEGHDTDNLSVIAGIHFWF